MTLQPMLTHQNLRDQETRIAGEMERLGRQPDRPSQHDSCPGTGGRDHRLLDARHARTLVTGEPPHRVERDVRLGAERPGHHGVPKLVEQNRDEDHGWPR